MHQQAVGQQVVEALRLKSMVLAVAARADVQLQCAFAARLAAVDAVVRAKDAVCSPSGRPRRRARGGPSCYLVDKAVHLSAAEEVQLRELSVLGNNRS